MCICDPSLPCTDMVCRDLSIQYPDFNVISIFLVKALVKFISKRKHFQLTKSGLPLR
jgi:hypothetical protein